MRTRLSAVFRDIELDGLAEILRWAQGSRPGRRSMQLSSAMHAKIAFVITTLSLLPQVAAAQPTLDRFRACLAIEDMTKERLDCFDGIARPEPKTVSAKPPTIAECRFYKEEDERLRCYNSFLTVRTAAPSRPAAQPGPHVPNERFRPCYVMDDMTKERLDCFDAIVRPEPRPAFTARPRTIFECRYFREQDDRLRCYINFTARIFKVVQRAVTPSPPRAQLPSATTTHVHRRRGGCGSRGGAGYRTRSGRCASRRH
jgi:hypothetical protein